MNEDNSEPSEAAETLDWSVWAPDADLPKEVFEQVPFLTSARDSQRPPAGDWRNWLFLGGRGSGKTRAGAEWICFSVRHGGTRRGALVGSTLSEVREVMIDGPSGIRAVAVPPGEESPVYEVTRRRVVFPNGAELHAFSAADPESLRGPQFEAAWCDELAAWPGAGAAWDMLQLGLRLGPRPRAMATTTPKPSKLIKRLVAEPITAVTRSTTEENTAHLAPGFMAVMRSQYGYGALAQQELDGEIVEPTEGALWTLSMLERSRSEEAPERFEDLLVAIDPPAGAGPRADACGIVAVGRAKVPGYPEHCFLLADASVRGLKPLDWAGRAVALCDEVGAVAIVAEANQGGEMVREVLELAGAKTPVRLVHARVDKRGRALPVATLYARGRVRHVGRFPELESEMMRFGTSAMSGSPDRLDALVWAVWALMIDGRGGRDPRLRRL